MITNKHDLAKQITHFFASPSVQSQISSFIQNTGGNESNLSSIFGNILTYMVCTRQGEIPQPVLASILKQSNNQGAFNCGNLVAKALLKQARQQNANANFDHVLQLFKQNFVSNGFYMHACNKAVQKSILQSGLVSNQNSFSTQRNLLSQYIPYEFDYRAYKLYVTSCYNTLYNYGVLSPEWLYNSVKDRQVMLQKNAGKAKQIILNKAAAHKNFKNENLPQLKQSISQIVDFYFKQKGYNIVVLDKGQKDELGRQVFNRYGEEEQVNESDFKTETVLEKAQQFLPASKQQTGLQSQADLFGNAINFLVNKYSVYELSTICSISPNNIAVAQLPCSSFFTKQQELEK